MFREGIGFFCAFGFVEKTSDGGKITSDGEEEGLEMERQKTSAGEGDDLRNGFRDGNVA